MSALSGPGNTPSSASASALDMAGLVADFVLLRQPIAGFRSHVCHMCTVPKTTNRAAYCAGNKWRLLVMRHDQNMGIWV